MISYVKEGKFNNDRQQFLGRYFLYLLSWSHVVDQLTMTLCTNSRHSHQRLMRVHTKLVIVFHIVIGIFT